MTAEALAMWDRALADLRAAGAIVEPFVPSVTLTDYRRAFADAEHARGDVAGNSRSPAATANALYRYFAGRTDDPRRRPSGAATRAYRSFYDVLPERFEDCVPLLRQPMERDPAGQSFARSRADGGRGARAIDARRRRRGDGLSDDAVQRVRVLADGWPDIRTPLGYGNWLGLPEVSVPAGLGADGLPALNLSVTGLPGDDARVLALAHAYERQSRRFVPPPRNPEVERAVAPAAAWLAFMIGLIVGGDVVDVPSFAFGAATGAAFVLLGLPAARRTARWMAAPARIACGSPLCLSRSASSSGWPILPPTG